MALTPEQVINKEFQPTKFREGYDQEEVDNFLDEVVQELRRLNKENDDLRREVADLEASGATATPASAVTGDDSGRFADEIDERDAQSQTQSKASAAPAQQSEQTAGYTDSSQSAAAVIAMAQKLHDDYVAQGKSEKTRLISEGESRAGELLTEAEAKRREVLENLESSRSTLEAQVQQLRGFEQKYRSELKNFLEGKLTDLQNTPRLEPQQQA